MQVKIRGEKIEVTESIKNYIEDKIGRLEKYFNNEDIVANVVIKSNKNSKTIEVTIPNGSLTLRREEINEDLYAAIDYVIDKLERQIRKNKSRLEKRLKVTNEVNFSLDFTDETPKEISQIVKRKNFDSKPMSEEEAILELELLNHDFFVFKNAEAECISVLYKRKDNNYGIINIK